MQAPRDRRIGLVILGLLAVVLAGLVIRRPEPPVDLAVYLRAGSQFATGGGLYEPGWGSPLDFPLPYTYPPVLAAAFAPVGWIPWRDAATLWTIANVAVLAWIVRVSFDRFLDTRGERRLRLTALLVVACALLGPVTAVFWFGQVGILLTAACLADTVRPRKRLPQGILVGAATAVKFTPGLFMVFWGITGRMRQAIVAVLSAIAVCAIAAALRPGLSVTFWTSVVFDNSRVGDASVASNQSMRGALLHLGISSGAVWAVLVLGALGVGLWRASLAHALGDELAAVTLVGLTSLVVSPVSWVHHAVWVVPALGVILDDGRDRRRVAAALAVGVVYLLRLPDWSGSVAGSIGTAFEVAYTAGFVVLLVALPIARRTQGVGTDPVGAAANERPA